VSRNLKLEVTKQLAKPGEEQRASPRVFQHRKHPGTRQPLKSDRLEKQTGDSGDDPKRLPTPIRPKNRYLAK
jgi:hypothetical protein